VQRQEENDDGSIAEQSSLVRPSWTPSDVLPPTHEWSALGIEQAVIFLNRRHNEMKKKDLGFEVTIAAATTACLLATVTAVQLGSVLMTVALAAVTLLIGVHGWKRVRYDGRARGLVHDALQLVTEPGASVFENGAFLQIRGSRTEEVRLMVGESGKLRNSVLPQARLLASSNAKTKIR
jgi:hypothetical protein